VLTGEHPSPRGVSAAIVDPLVRPPHVERAGGDFYVNVGLHDFAVAVDVFRTGGSHAL
jgi:hypothetical protein